MKPAVSFKVCEQRLELRRRHSLREVAEQTGLPIGTVKTIRTRSGAFFDNSRAQPTVHPYGNSTRQQHRNGRELPPQEAITGYAEIDAMLWLRSMIATGPDGAD